MAGQTKTLIKKLLIALPGFQWFCRRLSGRHVRVLMYHRFAPGPGDNRRLGAESFERHLAYIAKFHKVWSVGEHLNYYLNGREAEGSPVVVTVDDGYADFYDVANPLLQKHSIPAMLYVVSDFVGGKCWFWWDQLRYVLETTRFGDCNLQIDDRVYAHRLTTAAECEAAWDAIATDLSLLEPSRINAIVGRLADDLAVHIPETPPNEYRAVSWDQLSDMAKRNIDVGAHTRTHPALSRIEAQQIESEIAASREAIQNKLGDCSEVFCYPYGQATDYSEEAKTIVQQLGFSGAYVASEPDGRDLGPFELQRYSANDDWVNFCWKMCGAQYLTQRLLS